MIFQPVEYMNNKKLLLIGNAVVTKEPDYSKFDCIIRMNLGVQSSPIDVWIDNLVNKAHDSLGHIPDIKNIIRLNAEKDGKRLERMPKQLKPYTWLWNTGEFSIMCKELNYFRPTTGLISIYWILNNIKFKSFTITGYDFFQTPNRYTNEKHPTSKTYVYPCHDIMKDRYWILKWWNEGKYEII